eukprot:Blabericola_migrator_1__4637@NODE_2457_length_2732_cov_797_604878_g1538_i0_p1_GENE_NODE_2457_length_2732_cov_797_604878_g1538_i0NODE_2457_length_2732_cov_797_604878_g1538_i0_p1_ORF_typecomplete_len664_score122_68GST_N/PF02798_20/1_5e08GST_N/PF02798_20/7_1e10GST_C_3/PF14497_6/1_1e05GST_C_3/PF14497_6/1e08GST_N_3/PF13417_6/0_00031GST_N_3/PF13417_6/30GST_N_3/PF13417_6/1_5e07GST_N_4/PF17172_4/0_0038GST_N_4/PF17172_4/1_7e03GST_N_4/PF17172_4/0_18Tom37/PF10568_9/0_59Tom37/PF10568_9/7_8e03Tom37/PF10568_9
MTTVPKRPRRSSLGSAAMPPTKDVMTLYYFDLPGLAESIRFTLILGEAEFKEVRFTQQEWTSHYKARSPTGLAPWLEIGPTKLPESRAILTHVAKHTNLIAAASNLQLHGEMLVDLCADMLTGPIAIAKQMPMEERFVFMGQQFAALIDSDKILSVENALAVHQSEEGYALGSLTYVDCYLATYYNNFLGLVPPEVKTKLEEKCPKWTKLRSLIYELPAIKDYVRKYAAQIVIESSLYSWRAQLVMNALDLGRAQYTLVPTEDVDSTVNDKPVTLVLNKEERFTDLAHILEWVEARCQLTPENMRAKDLNFLILIQAVLTEVCTPPTGDPKSDESKVDEPKAEELKTEEQKIEEQKAEEQKAGEPKTEEGAEQKRCDQRKELHQKIDELLKDESVVTSNMNYSVIACALLYEVLINSADIGYEGDLSMLEHCYTTVYANKRVRRSVLTRVKPSLYYFNFVNRGEGPRMMLHIADIPFNDVRVPGGQEWVEKHKSKSPSGQVPVLEVGKELFVEANAITEFIADCTGYVPLTTKGRLIANLLVAITERPLPVIGHGYSLGDEGGLKYRQEHVPPVLDLVEKLVVKYKQPGKWTVENRVTYVDVLLASLFLTMRDCYKCLTPEDAESRWPVLRQITQNIIEIPRIASYRDKVLKTINYPLFRTNL